MPARPIQIVGGGLAGLTLGIALRARNVPVEIWEAGAYPRHRVCGEVLRGRGTEILRELRMLGAVLAAGGQLARTTGFYLRTRGFLNRLASPAVCIARFRLDHLLAERFQALGGELRTGQRWTGRNDEPGIVRA